jgi:DNA-binding NarL/FixJ family response regulator
MGDEMGAERAFSQARSITTMAPMPFQVALLNLDDARRLCRFGHGPAAVARLEEAHKAFSQLGADPFVQTCASELAQLHVTAAAQGPAALVGLSRAELAVARLVADGLTNRQAAAELFVSVKTVEYHLRHCYMKLDITSRRALASLIG